MVIRNNTKKTLRVNTSTIAYGIDDRMISTTEGEFEALGAGCTTVIKEAFETDETILRYDTAIDTSETSYKSVIDKMSYKKYNIKDGVIFQVTNNGLLTARFAECYVLFLKNGALVDYDYAYFDNDDCELLPGTTISKQFNCYDSFDDVEFYLGGYGY
ncbi:hypothetical protein [Eubacterium xylanophilum]|uniref:hypothetical protein n=1 Tax=Eubacterium xylanophilum TaxID=39497 RepID=UPI0005531732|nr:hypothetical protein [Eubacterium xylanophilum]